MCGSFPGLLIGRTAVHSGKDPAFVAYDQFLSTGILQPLSRGEVRCGSFASILPCPFSRPLSPTADTMRHLTRSPHRRAIGLLRPRHERPGCRCAAESQDELAPLHSITSSARASSAGGTSKRTALAVLRLITSSNLVGWLTGRSAGLAPLRTRAV